MLDLQANSTMQFEATDHVSLAITYTHKYKMQRLAASEEQTTPRITQRRQSMSH